ncbi:MAG: FMN-binding glutamate synthase family protein [Fimbriimonadaceae bacterium]|nr:FMN-binding glutamate synthase family protein [Fimbriimonadaceae bacterium]
MYDLGVVRYIALILVLVGLIATLGLALWQGYGWWIGVGVFGFFALVGVADIVQKRNNIRRNYPVIGHGRFLLLKLRPELHQYFVEDDTSGTPFSWEQRTLVYDRANGKVGLDAFGTELDVYRPGYIWFEHSIAAKHIENSDLRVMVGGKDCLQPYSCSLYNISAMSFGSLSANAIQAMNRGAKLGGFAHCTGEGGLSSYHLSEGADVVWQIGTGYFGCRRPDGGFDAEKFKTNATRPTVKMIEIKISQGAKPGHGGVLPGAKVTQEIADARGVQLGEDCISPPAHSAFDSPLGLCEFIGQLRELSGGKPIGFKLCIGSKREFMAICRAMVETGITPDFITVDGGEGGTGAAPVEFSDSMGMPLADALPFVVQALRGCGLKDEIRVAASGKVFSAASLLENLAKGADWCNAARGYMLAVGCIQAQVCHTNECPVGVATQDQGRQKGVNVIDKGEKVRSFHALTMRALADMVGAMGYEHPEDVSASMVWRRMKWGEAKRVSEEYPTVEYGGFLREDYHHPDFSPYWEGASSDRWT